MSDIREMFHYRRSKTLNIGMEVKQDDSQSDESDEEADLGLEEDLMAQKVPQRAETNA